ncbi:MAG: UDP-N-acetylmuramoyl-L-alanine--D-glutamate ligase [Candidatus Harrisonbacteria bacterium CG10_big_fil_rev_8_21_14_0_10_45_28]|uniref:UDP-N-acetylmuramoylalanine--D-glutamate ligase n=1 Tax=Candidatus Harrisonbacteria bacterium CG10_big_fil_rev_8_21_14_0_10_45_28 TaxID=1974586 RepID=A0A2H0UPD2_9BACT|nr:MAG: UDP-N-acetylmuramoyl-L-alanine--D-glutamate ligase [Candidatus Harrisonbacteria bacterium CG10_big_fil_rev_8_21_14_0_10_45_28]
MQKIAILGFGKEGKAIFHYFSRKGVLKDNQIYILTKDKDTDALGLDAANENVFAKYGPDYLEDLAGYDQICRSPGFSINSPEIKSALKAHKDVTSATKLFFKEISHLNKKPITVGVTGTKGKGTVSTLLFDILKKAEKKVALVGNIGKPALEILPEINSLDYIILELSSFQLHDLTVSPNLAVVLDISPDHLDAHKNLREYTGAKTNIASHQTPTDAVVYLATSKTAKSVARKSLGQKIPVDPDAFKMFSQSQVHIPGSHTFLNTVMAATAASYLQISEQSIRKAVGEFTGLPHRLEKVQNPKHQEIVFYNDSYATNPESTAAAVKSFEESLILIAGGKDKGLKYKSLAKALKHSSTERVILFGENRKKIEHAIKSKWKGDMEFAKDLSGALYLAVNYAKQLNLSHRHIGLATNKVVILFSPASASFDMFANATERGEKFKDLVKNL